jgi:predicted ATPase
MIAECSRIPERATNLRGRAGRGYTADPAQLRAVDALERCAQEWAVFKEKRSNAFKS